MRIERKGPIDAARLVVKYIRRTKGRDSLRSMPEGNNGESRGVTAERHLLSSVPPDHSELNCFCALEWKIDDGRDVPVRLPVRDGVVWVWNGRER